MAIQIDPNELPANVRKSLKIRKNDFSKEKVRSYALRILAEIAELTQLQRKRVLDHARKVNEI